MCDLGAQELAASPFLFAIVFVYSVSCCRSGQWGESDVFGVLGDFYVQWGELTLPVVPPTWSTPYMEPKSVVQTSPRIPTCVFRSPLCVSLSSWMIGRCQKLDVSKIGFLVFLSAPPPPLQLRLSLPPLMTVPFIRLFRPKALWSPWSRLLLWHLSLGPAGSTGGPAFSVGSVC